MAPPNPQPKRPLDMLQVLVDDVLVQAGKALRNARQDGPAKVGLTHVAMKAKLPETIARFHAALDDLEGDIIRAKSTLLRDLESEQAKKAAPKQAQPTPTPVVAPPKVDPVPQPQPQPIEAQSKEPMVIDLDSSPPPEPQPANVPDQKDVKPRAPFPDMGMGPSSSHTSTPMVKEESASSLNIKRPDSPGKMDATAVVKNEKAAPPAPMAPMPNMDIDVSSSINAGPVDAPAAQMTDADSNFTDMQFSLAPPTNDLQPMGMDGSGGGANDMLSLDNIFPADAKGDDMKEEKSSGDWYQGTADDPQDGMDFDFGLGDDEFNSYMDARDDNLDLANSDFNASFFNLDGTEDA